MTPPTHKILRFTSTAVLVVACLAGRVYLAQYEAENPYGNWRLYRNLLDIALLIAVGWHYWVGLDPELELWGPADA